MKKTIRKNIELGVLFGLVCAIALSFSCFEARCDELRNGVLRLHIIANSNCGYDQAIKLDVRDNIIEFIDEKGFESKSDVSKSIVEIEGKIREYLKVNNVGYDCRVFVGKSEFPTKEYNNISIPCGEYECVKVILGEGFGENWWCIAYPPLCFTESVTGDISEDGDERLKEYISNNSYNIIKGQRPEFKIKFKVVEVINSIFK